MRVDGYVCQVCGSDDIEMVGRPIDEDMPVWGQDGILWKTWKPVGPIRGYCKAHAREGDLAIKEEEWNTHWKRWPEIRQMYKTAIAAREEAGEG